MPSERIDWQAVEAHLQNAITCYTVASDAEQIACDEAALRAVRAVRALPTIRHKYAHVNEANDRFVMGYNAALDAMQRALDAQEGRDA